MRKLIVITCLFLFASFASGQVYVNGVPTSIASSAITAVGTAAYNGVIRTGVYKRAWTNAEVVALGAVDDAELKIATLPAKTIVRNAYVVVETPETVLTDLTVALGRTGPGYIDYIVASDAQVEVLGDELVINGTFTGSAAGWTLGLGGGTPDWFYDTNKVTRYEFVTDTAPLISTAFAVVAGHTYKVVFDFTEGNNGVVLTYAGFESDLVSSSGTYTYYVTAAATGNTTVTLTPENAAAECSIDNVSVTELVGVVYGDAVAERGTNLTGYDLPSYAAAVDVYLNFVTTDGSHTLADALQCTGQVYLLTERLP